VCIVNIFFRIFFKVLKTVIGYISPYYIFSIFPTLRKNIIILKMRIKSTPSLYMSPNIIFYSMIFVLAVYLDRLNIAAFSFITFFFSQNDI